MMRSIALVAAASAAALVCSSARAEELAIDFENPPYVLGVIDGQDGWSSFGAAGSGCALYDHAVAINAYGYAAFGGQSLRISNARTSGCFGDQTYSRSLANDAGESTADGGTYSGGLRKSRFEASWDFASTVPGAEQPGLSVVASPDRGDGARMSWIQMADGPGGLSVNFYEYLDNAPFGPGDANANTHDDGCDVEDEFRFAPVATGLDRTVPHTIRVVMDFKEGSRNDVVQVFVDGVLGYTGTSWEDYFRYCEDNPTRPVDSILFRTAGPAAFATLGNGFVIDNLNVKSAPRNLRIDVRPNNQQNQINTGAKQLVPVAILGEAGFDPVLEVDVTSVLMRSGRPLSTKFDRSDVNGDGFRDFTLYFRARDIDNPTASECSDPAAMITLEGNTTDGQSFAGTDRVTWLGC